MMANTVSGKYCEELEGGQIYRHPITRTVAETDNLLFSALTYNSQPVHLDEEFSKKTMYGTRIVNSVFTLGLVTGVVYFEIRGFNQRDEVVAKVSRVALLLKKPNT
jgi:acyl dehydratase